MQNHPFFNKGWQEGKELPPMMKVGGGANKREKRNTGEEIVDDGAGTSRPDKKKMRGNENVLREPKNQIPVPRFPVFSGLRNSISNI